MFVIAVFFYWSVGTLGIDTIGDIWLAITFQSSPGHLWTIPAELGFYCVLFIVLFAMNRAKVGLGASWTVALLVLTCCLLAYIWPPFSTPSSSPASQWYLPTFACGIAAAAAAKWAGHLSTWKYNISASASAAMIVAFIVFGKGGIFGDPKDFLINKHLIFGVMWSVFVFSIYGGGGLWSRLLSARWLVAVGRWSFSIYLFHWAIGIYASTYLPSFAGCTVGVLTSIGVGYCGYRWPETFFNGLRKPLVAILLGRRIDSAAI
jgi:peptidoglycan/LPS O-acetylase OafA/YrhL